MSVSGCGGGSGSEVSERELYGDKRADCRTTKRTDQGANVMQCSQIRADDKEINDSSELSVEDNWEDTLEIKTLPGPGN